MTIFDLDQFKVDCRSARDANEPQRAVREVVERALRDRSSVADTLRPERGGITTLANEPDLTIAHIVWAPGMDLLPHDHRMWAVIGVYTGREDNAFYRRVALKGAGIEATGGRALAEGDVLSLGTDAVHGVKNRLDRLTGALHVYGGDFIHAERSQWGPGDREERPYDWAYVEAEFERKNVDYEARR